MGFWANEGVEKEVVTVYEGLKRRFPNVTVNYADGYDLETNDLRLSEARAAANRADVIVVAKDLIRVEKQSRGLILPSMPISNCW